jgi:DnaA N-terminal domain
MGLKLQNLVWQNRELKNSRRTMMLAIADKHFDNAECLESDIETLSGLANVCSKQGKRILHRLHDEGFINFQSGRGRGNRSKVFINKEKLSEIKGDISDDKRGHFEPKQEIKGDILNQNENKRGHFEPLKGDISDDKRGHFSRTRAAREILPSTEQITEREVADTTAGKTTLPKKENSDFENCVAVRMFTKTFGSDFRQSFLNAICLTVKNTDIWEKLLLAKSHKTPKMVGGWILDDYSVELKVYETAAETAKILNQIYKPPQPPETEEFEEFETENYEKFINKKADGYADWLKLIAEIKNALHEQTFASWFGSLSFYGVDREKQAFIVGGTEVNQDWIEMNYLELIEKTAKKIGLENWSFEWKK